MEANALRRIGAYIIDLIIISFFLSLFMVFVPVNTNDDLTERRDEIIELSLEQEEISSDLINEYGEISYEIEHDNLLIKIARLTFVIFYFVIYQKYNNGKTLGKKLLKIKVIQNDGQKTTHKNLLIRGLLINSIFYSVFSILFLFIIKGYNYSIITYLLAGLETILVIISLFMIIYRKDKRGLHDLIGKTKVVLEDS